MVKAYKFYKKYSFKYFVKRASKDFLWVYNWVQPRKFQFWNSRQNIFVVKITPKGGLISEGILTLVSLPKRGAKSGPWAENLNKLFTPKGGKFKLSVQWRDLAPFFWQIKLPLAKRLQKQKGKNYWNEWFESNSEYWRLSIFYETVGS